MDRTNIADLRIVLYLFYIISGTCWSKRSAWASETALDQQMPVRGIVRSAKQSAISTELTARVDSVSFKEGEQFF